jgi:hypothetical protein
MLTRYEETKGRDMFGRCGSGIPRICRPAIFKGIQKQNGVYSVLFREYRVNTFMTKQYYYLEHDYIEHPGLRDLNTSIPIDNIGIYDSFVGRLYQFSRPIQQSAEESFVEYDIGQDGKIGTIKRTLAEHIKDVLDDFEIEYDEESLNLAITETAKMGF